MLEEKRRSESVELVDTPLKRRARPGLIGVPAGQASTRGPLCELRAAGQGPGAQHRVGGEHTGPLCEWPLLTHKRRPDRSSAWIGHQVTGLLPKLVPVRVALGECFLEALKRRHVLERTVVGDVLGHADATSCD